MSPKHVKCIILQANSICNLNCTYCYIPEKQRKEKLLISLKTIKEIFSKLFQSSVFSKYLNINWHAGEPFMVPISYYEEIAEIISHYNKNNIPTHHAFQTNGVLINDEWCDFLKQINCSVGVSIDGPESIHNLHRKTWGGSGSHKYALKGFHLLKNAGIETSILAVITKFHLNKANDFYSFFKKNKVNKIGLNPESILSSNQNSSLDYIENIENQYLEFLESLYQLNLRDKKPLIIREFDTIEYILQKKYKQPLFSIKKVENNPGELITIKSNGNIYTHSPQLANGTVKNSEQFLITSIKDINTFDDIFKLKSFKKLNEEINKGVQLCKKECELFSFCGGGCPAGKFYEHGRFDTTINKRCHFGLRLPVEAVVKKGLSYV